MVVGLGTVLVTVEAGNVIVVSEPRIDVVIVEAGLVYVVTSIVVSASQNQLAESTMETIGAAYSHDR